MDNFGRALYKNAAELTVMDVYDIAAVVGQEFEHIIDQYGCEALLRLMPKVVRVLEILEVLVSRNNICSETEELRLELDRLRLERKDRKEKEKKHQKELELVEDVWRGEAQELLSQITELQAQNETLRTSLTLNHSPDTEEERPPREGMSDRERQAMKKLKEVVDKQKNEIRTKDHELTLKNEDLEALQMQQHRLMRINQELRHRLAAVDAQGKALTRQRAEQEAQSQARQQELGVLRVEVARLREEHQERGVPDRGAKQEEGGPSTATAPTEKATFSSAAASNIQNSIWVECGMDREFLAECFGPAEPLALLPPQTDGELKEEEDNGHEDEDVPVLLWEEQEEEEGGTPDPNQPRFTLQELQDVLQERNQLKAQVFLMQEELAYYKSEEETEEEMSPLFLTPSPSPSPQPPSNDQPESGIKTLFKFFSRDKSQTSQRTSHPERVLGSKQDDLHTQEAPVATVTMDMDLIGTQPCAWMGFPNRMG